MKAGLTATKLRIILTLALIAIVGLGVALHLTVGNMVQNYAVSVNKKSSEAASSDERLRQLSSLKSNLEKHKKTMQRVSHIAAEQESYNYQDQVIQDLERYAQRSGISISSISFSGGSSSTSGSAPAAAAPAAPATSGAAAPAEGAPAGAVAQPAASGASPTLITLTPKTPMSYDGFIKFLHAVENNLTRMQVSNLAIARSEEDNGLAISTIALEVYIK